MRKEDDGWSRFWPKTRPGPNGCLEWTSWVTGEGYGNFYLRGRDRRAHRVAWELIRGAIPDGLFVCHTCDNRLCVNIEHLFLGTNSDNMHDMRKKGRAANRKGTRNPRAILSREQVNELRAMVSDGRLRLHGPPRGPHAAANVTTRRSIAKRWGVSPQTISAVLHGQNWDSRLPAPSTPSTFAHTIVP